MLSQSKVGAIVFFVLDLSRSVAFYRDTLGLPVEVVEGHDGDFATGQVGELSLVFIVHDAPAGKSPVVVFTVAGGIDDYAEALAARGVEIVVPVGESPDGGLSLDFIDPDHNLLSVHKGPGSPRRNA
ncbi:MAG: VOC family protein [Pseudoxanthomonas sp.]